MCHALKMQKHVSYSHICYVIIVLVSPWRQQTISGPCAKNVCVCVCVFTTCDQEHNIIDLGVTQCLHSASKHVA